MWHEDTHSNITPAATSPLTERMNGMGVASRIKWPTRPELLITCRSAVSCNVPSDSRATCLDVLRWWCTYECSLEWVREMVITSYTYLGPGIVLCLLLCMVSDNSYRFRSAWYMHWWMEFLSNFSLKYWKTLNPSVNGSLNLETLCFLVLTCRFDVYMFMTFCFMTTRKILWSASVLFSFKWISSADKHWNAFRIQITRWNLSLNLIVYSFFLRERLFEVFIDK